MNPTSTNPHRNSPCRIFRTLNSNEKSLILTAAKKGRIPAEDPRVEYIEDLQVSYEYMQGGFCICILALQLNTFKVSSVDKTDHILFGARVSSRLTIYRGASRRSYKDPRNSVRGEMLAFSRAILFSRFVEIA